MNFENLNFEFVSNFGFRISDFQISSANLVYIIYTSGTTGRPKGVMIEHSALINFIYAMYGNYNSDFKPSDHCLSLTNFSFDVSVCEIFMPLVFGASVILLPQGKIFDPIELAATVVSASITFAYIPPGLLKDVYANLKRLIS